MVQDGCPTLDGYHEDELKQAQSAAIELIKMNQTPEDYPDLSERTKEIVTLLMTKPSEDALFVFLCNLDKKGKGVKQLKSDLEDVELAPVIRFRAQKLLSETVDTAI